MNHVENWARVATAASLLTEDQIEEGKHWYPDANRTARRLAKRYGVTVRQVAGVMAALSARESWKTNKRKTARYLAGQRNVHTTSNIDKCDRIMQVDDDESIMQILNGDKTARFYHNIMYPYSSEYVTLDSWMTNLIEVPYGQLKVKAGYSSTLYERYERAVTMIANGLNMRGLELQAALWIADRGTGE